ncbi:hypothetical protein PVAND_011174 [Polypedilum vanderplanki]|uniref:Protein LMBR1L n=1 Tax=Polypedilum vanderplanki TaxID=319348 RepID=A0A9J6CIH6_POLVA|nr:hypothetical protein PVAND_011174 [Polypedilum vanderplanki]
MDLVTSLEEEDEIVNEETLTFHSNVRENIIFVLLFLLLLVGSYTLIERFRRRDREDLYSTEDDELKVYRISLLFCVFSFAVAIGSACLLPISIISNEVLLLYPNSYYVQWLNSSLIQGLWTFVFLFSNVAIFILLPFAYLFSESTGFLGHKKGILPRLYETFVVFSLLSVIIIGLVYVLMALFSERSNFLSILNITTYLPFLYSCVSFIGVLLLLVCTPIGFIRLFSVVSKVLVKPILLRDVNDEFIAYNMEEAAVLRKIESNKFSHNGFNSFFQLSRPNNKLSTLLPSKLCSDLEDLSFSKLTNGVPMNDKSLLEIQINIATGNQHVYDKIIYDASKEYSANAKHYARLRQLENERSELQKQRSSSCLQRNFGYPFAMLLLLILTSITVLLVMQNTIELLIGIKALPLSSRQFTLGISSLSKLGVFGAAIEIIIILYLALTSAVGFYTMPIFSKIRPKRRKTSLSHIIANCLLLLILTSALPLLSRILGITNFDLLGDFGKVEWLGNFILVLLYNFVFIVTTGLCIINKFTAAVRQELFERFGLQFLMNENAQKSKKE